MKSVAQPSMIDDLMFSKYLISNFDRFYNDYLTAMKIEKRGRYKSNGEVTGEGWYHYDPGDWANQQARDDLYQKFDDLQSAPNEYRATNLLNETKGWEVFAIKYGERYTDLFDFGRYEDKVEMAGVSVLEPHVNIGMHHDDAHGNIKFIRYHFPLIIPDGECYFILDDKKVIWEKGVPICFDVSTSHGCINNTDEHRCVLLVDYMDVSGDIRKHLLA